MILFAMQMHAGDVDAGCGLLDLVADLLEPLPVNAGLMLVLGPGVMIPPIRMLRWEKHFTALHVHSVGEPDGRWPVGANRATRAAWRAFLDLKQYDALWLAEPDSVPTRPDFFTCVTAEWALRPEHRHVMGFYVASVHPQFAHINGNCIISREFARVCPDFLTDPRLERTAWDAVYREVMVKHGHPSRTIFSKHGWGATPKKPWHGPDELFQPFELPQNHPHWPRVTPAWVHGTKKWQEAQAGVRARLLNREPSAISGHG